MSLIEQALGKSEFQENVENSSTSQLGTSHKRLQIRKGFTTRTTVLLILPLVVLIVTGLLFYQKSDSLVGSLRAEKGNHRVQSPAEDSMNTPLLSREALAVNAAVPDTRGEALPAKDTTKGNLVKREDLKHEAQLLKETVIEEGVAEGTIAEETVAVARVDEGTLVERTAPFLLKEEENPGCTSGCCCTRTA